MDQTDPKIWYKSRGIVGPLVSLVAIILRTTGIADLGDEEVNQVTNAVLEITAAAGVFVGIIGRAKATQTIEKAIK